MLFLFPQFLFHSTSGIPPAALLPESHIHWPKLLCPVLTKIFRIRKIQLSGGSFCLSDNSGTNKISHVHQIRILYPIPYHRSAPPPRTSTRGKLYTVILHTHLLTWYVVGGGQHAYMKQVSEKYCKKVSSWHKRNTNDLTKQHKN